MVLPAVWLLSVREDIVFIISVVLLLPTVAILIAILVKLVLIVLKIVGPVRFPKNPITLPALWLPNVKEDIAFIIPVVLPPHIAVILIAIAEKPARVALRTAGPVRWLKKPMVLPVFWPPSVRAATA